MTMDVQNKSIHFMQMPDIKAKFYIFQEKHSQMKTFITKDRQKLPLVDPLS